MKHLNLKLEKLEQRVAAGLTLPDIGLVIGSGSSDCSSNESSTCTSNGSSHGSSSGSKSSDGCSS
jgi:hypothetical protein